MKTGTNGKKRTWRFGDFIADTYGVWGRQRAKEIVRVAVNARLIEFRGRQRFVISEKEHEIIPI